MKWYSHPTFVKHKADIKSYKQGVGRYYEWVPKIAAQFNREYANIGILDYNDLIQAGHVGLLQSWTTIRWDEIENAIHPDAKLWNYIKKRIKWAIRREIDKYSSHIAVPINRQENGRNTADWFDRTVVTLFPAFFDTAFPNLIEEQTPYWETQVLGEIIDDYLYSNVKNIDHVEILRAHYGIDRDKRASSKELAEKYRTSPKYIGLVISRLKNKLKKDDNFKKIIENFYENQIE